MDRDKEKTAYIGGALTDVRLTIEEWLIAFRSVGVARWMGMLLGFLLFNSSALGEFMTFHQARKTQNLKDFYEELAAAWERITGIPAFVPHRFYDPVKNAEAQPPEVRAFEGGQIHERTKVLVAVLFEPATGVGIEMGWSEVFGIPIIIVRMANVSRLPLGLHKVTDIRTKSRRESLQQFEQVVRAKFTPAA